MYDTVKRKDICVVAMETSSNKKTVQQRLAHGISEIFNPLFVALPTFFVVALFSAPDVWHALLWWIVAVLGISVAPFLFVWQGVRKGTYTDHHVSKREQRFVPLFFGLACTILSFLFLYLLHASFALIATMISVIVACGIALAVTRYWKISLHLIGLAGAVTVCVLLYGPHLLLLAPLVPLVAWARWEVRAHTVLQAIAGTLLAVGVTLLTFLLFGIYR
jgi:hypothetical protein